MTLKSATPNALKYEYAYDGSGSLVGDVLQTQLITDAATAGPGPSLLKQLLEAITDNTIWAAAPGTGLFSLLITPVIQSTAASTIAGKFNTATARSLRVTGVGLGNGDLAIVELRAHVTPER
jgi:hypothetical protein